MAEDVDGEGGCLDSLGAVLIAPVLLVLGCGVLFWNEGRAVQRARDLDRGRGAVVQGSAEEVDAEQDGELLYMQGEMEVDGTLEDPLTGVETEAVRLWRIVEMYQWEEEVDREEETGRTEKEYDYYKVWSSDLNDSSTFHESSTHTNPDSMPIDDRTTTADPVRVGAHVLSEQMIDRVAEQYELSSVDESLRSNLPEEHRSEAVFEANKLYLDGRANTSEIGDVRLQYAYQPPARVSLVAGVEGETITPYSSPKLNGRIGLIETGRHTAQDLFDEAERQNRIEKWAFRAAGWLLLVVAFSAMFAPLEAAAGMIPLVGGLIEDFIEIGTRLVAGVLGTGSALIVIAAGWIFYRPLVGSLLLLGAAAMIGGIVYLALKLSPRTDLFN